MAERIVRGIRAAHPYPVLPNNLARWVTHSRRPHERSEIYPRRPSHNDGDWPNQVGRCDDYDGRLRATCRLAESLFQALRREVEPRPYTAEVIRVPRHGSHRSGG